MGSNEDTMTGELRGSLKDCHESRITGLGVLLHPPPSIPLLLCAGNPGVGAVTTKSEAMFPSMFYLASVGTTVSSGKAVVEAQVRNCLAT